MRQSARTTRRIIQELAFHPSSTSCPRASTNVQDKQRFIGRDNTQESDSVTDTNGEAANLSSSTNPPI